MIKILTDKILIQINQMVLNSKSGNYYKDKLGLVFSSYHYYESDEDQIASAVRSLIKNHVFIDGNKRTAYLVFMTLAHENEIPINRSKDFGKLFENIAASNYSVEKIAELLFK